MSASMCGDLYIRVCHVWTCVYEFAGVCVCVCVRVSVVYVCSWVCVDVSECVHTCI